MESQFSHDPNDFAGKRSGEGLPTTENPIFAQLTNLMIEERNKPFVNARDLRDGAAALRGLK